MNLHKSARQTGDESEPVLCDADAKAEGLAHASPFREPGDESDAQPFIRPAADGYSIKFDAQQESPPLAGINMEAKTAEEIDSWLASTPTVHSVGSPEGRTELSNARRFTSIHGENVKYCPGWERWLVWDGTRWLLDEGVLVEALAKDIADRVWDDAAARMRIVERAEAQSLLSYGKAMASANGVVHTLMLARSEECLRVHHEQLDVNPWLLNVQNGTLDLASGRLLPFRKTDLLTKIAPVIFDPARDCPIWEAFLVRIMPNTDVRNFLKRLVGYWLTGSIRDHILPICYGTGANGKSVFLNTIVAMLGGDYSGAAAPDLLMATKQSPHPTQIADLFGRRLMCSMESGESRALNEPLIKYLTGGDRIKARRMQEDFWEFAPTHKLVMATNHRPKIKGTDNGVWRRLLLIPFTETIPPDEQDKSLPDKLRAELSGILNWALAGFLELQAGGLQEPDAVKAATAVYRSEEDVIRRFIAERCSIDSRIEAGASVLYKAFQKWCGDFGEACESQKKFGTRLTDIGFGSRRSSGNGSTIRTGIGLLIESEPSEGLSG